MTAKTTKPVHGGARVGAGRKPRASEAGRIVPVLIAPEEEAELVAGLAEGETLSDILRAGAIALVRRRRSPS